jgi:membrane protein YqaA with SNARE-associated domain
MKLVALIILSAAAIFVPGSPEGLAVYYVRDLHWSVLAVAVLSAVGQCTSYWLLYLFGEFLVQRWRWLRQQVTRTRERYAFHLERRFLTVTTFSAVIGVPPAIATSTLAPGFEIPLRHLMPILLGGRVVRLVVLILFWNRVLTWARTWI